MGANSSAICSSMRAADPRSAGSSVTLVSEKRVMSKNSFIRSSGPLESFVKGAMPVYFARRSVELLLVLEEREVADDGGGAGL